MMYKRKQVSFEDYSTDKVEDIEDLMWCLKGELERKEFDELITTLNLIENKVIQLKTAVNENRGDE